jgi:hypothetical protein
MVENDKYDFIIFPKGFFIWKINGMEASSALHIANNFTISLFVMFALISTTSSPTLSDVVIAIIFDMVLCAILYYVGKIASLVKSVNFCMK